MIYLGRSIGAGDVLEIQTPQGWEPFTVSDFAPSTGEVYGRTPGGEYERADAGGRAVRWPPPLHAPTLAQALAAHGISYIPEPDARAFRKCLTGPDGQELGAFNAQEAWAELRKPNPFGLDCKGPREK